MSARINLLCDVLDNQRRLTKWYLKKIPATDLTKRLSINSQELNSPLWIIAHLIWTDYGIGMLPLGYKEAPPEWVQNVSFGSSGELPEGFPTNEEILGALDDTHEKKLAFFKSLADEVLDGEYAHKSLGFKNNYYALLHLARHEGVHCGQLAAFCKFESIKTA